MSSLSSWGPVEALSYFGKQQHLDEGTSHNLTTVLVHQCHLVGISFQYGIWDLKDERDYFSFMPQMEASSYQIPGSVSKGLHPDHLVLLQLTNHKMRTLLK